MRRVAVRAVNSVGSVLARLALDTLFALFSLVAFIAFVALLAVVNRNRVGVAERNGVAHLLAVLRYGRNGSDVVGGVQQLLEGSDVAVHLLLPRFERLDAVGVVVHLLPQGGVVVVVATCRECQRENRYG